MEKVESLVLRELLVSRKNFWELVDRINLPLKNLITGINRLIESGLISCDENGFYLTKKGRILVKRKDFGFESKICPTCFGKRIVYGAKFNKILKKFKKIVANRPQPSSDFFQAYTLEQEVIARIALMNYYDDLNGKDIILIGDDDLVSIALALTDVPSSIVVVDIDKRLGDFIKTVNGDYGFNIKFYEYDVAYPLPKSLREKFDVFSSEPLETFSGLRTFILRGVGCLKENGVGYFGLTFYEASHKKWLTIEKLLAEMNCVITDIIQGFSIYPTKYETVNYDEFAQKLGFNVCKNPGINWYKSALFRFEVLGKAKLPVNWEKKLKVRSIDPEEDLTHPNLYL